MKRVLFFLFISFFLPSTAMASDFYFDSVSSEVTKGDVFIVKLKISTTDNAINAVDGSISFDKEKLEIKETSAGGSIFSLWPDPVSFFNDKGVLNFVGGVAGGFQSAEGEILKIIFLAKEEGKAGINLNTSSLLFLNDGKGTIVPYETKPLDLLILKRAEGSELKDEWQPFLTEDKTPPESFEIVIGSSPSVFGGNKFISFFTTDKETGVDYFEIKEGDGPFVKGNSPYELKDQSLRSKIEVKAVDKADNERVVVLKPAGVKNIYQKLLFWGIIILALVFLCLGGKLVWRRKIHY